MDFPLALQLEGNTHAYIELATTIKNAIESGRLKPGDLLPGTPQLALQLGRSRSTIVRCYEELLSQKYVESIPGVGTRVSLNAQTEVKISERTFEFDLSAYGERLVEQANDPRTAAAFPEMNFGAFPSDMLPLAQWRQILLSICREFDPDQVVYSHDTPLGYPPLREAVGAYLRRNRGVICDVDQVCVFPHSLHAINLISRLLINPGDIVAVEEPGFPYARSIFQALGATIISVPVDANGLCVNKLWSLPRECKMIYVTPSHQDPTGPVMPMERRLELLRWAKETKTIVIEDDYDSEYRYEGATLPALQSLDTQGLVVYVSSFWKVLHPLSAAGYMVIPKKLIEAVSRAEELDEFSFPLLELLALTELLTRGHLERHIKKTKSVYRARLHAVIRALAVNLRTFATPSKESSGSHLLVRLRSREPDDVILELAEEAGLSMISTSVYYREPANSGEFLIGFAHLSEEEIEASVARFAELLLSGEEDTSETIMFEPPPQANHARLSEACDFGAA